MAHASTNSELIVVNGYDRMERYMQGLFMLDGGFCDVSSLNITDFGGSLDTIRNLHLQSANIQDPLFYDNFSHILKT